MHKSIEDRVSSMRDSVRGFVGSYAFNKPMDLLRESSQRVDELERSLLVASSHIVQLAEGNNRALGQRLETLSPKAVLKRGYTIVRKKGEVVASSGILSQGDVATIQFHDGSVKTRVEQ